ncbi:uncharacterized protein EI90DRAFT_3035699, partial [Cantharellus anzutake]|uniref:uncharacterized protein n=1 Tax=Cantharellus anzutake TaxID=1750568 RepID=UPI0019070F8A
PMESFWVSSSPRNPYCAREHNLRGGISNIVPSARNDWSTLQRFWDVITLPKRKRYDV